MAQIVEDGDYRIQSAQGATKQLCLELRDDSTVIAVGHNNKINKQLWKVKAIGKGQYQITNYATEDASVYYLIHGVDNVSGSDEDDDDRYRWVLDARGPSFIIGDGDKAIDVDRNHTLMFLPRTNGSSRQLWNFVKDGGGDKDKGGTYAGLIDWQKTDLETGIYFVISKWENECAIWNYAEGEIGPLITWPKTTINNSEHFLGRAFLFVRNANGSYSISSYGRPGKTAIRRYLTTKDGAPVATVTKNDCRLFAVDGESDTYVVSTDLKSHPATVIIDPSGQLAGNATKIQTVGTLTNSGLSSGMKWRLVKAENT